MNSNTQPSSGVNQNPFLRTVDGVVAVPTIVMLLVLIIWIMMDDGNVTAKMNQVTNFYTSKFGDLYLVLGLVCLLVSLYLVFSKYGNIKIGKPDDKPEYNDFQYWMILFCSALGAGICIWGLAEPLYIMKSSVYGLKAGSPQMAEKALSYAFLHWGWIPWAFFGLPGVMYGYYIHNKSMAPRFTMPLRSLFGEKHYNGVLVKLAEAILLMASVAATPILIINGVYLVTSGLNLRFGIAISNTSRAVVCLLICLVCFWSALRDIKRGLGKVSKFNIFLCFFVCGFIFLITDPFFIMKYATTAMGDLLSNFFKMALWCDPVEKGGFPQTWTIVYWIWWLVAAFITGLIFANLCKGRTIRQALLPIIFLSPLMAFIWFATWSGGALASDLQDGTNYLTLLDSLGKEGLAFQFVMDLPLGKLVVVPYIVLIAVFVCTTTDAFCLCYAQVSTKEEYFKARTGQTVEPPAKSRLLYCLLATVLSYLLMLSNIDFNGMQALGATTTFPCIFLFYLFIYAFIRDLGKDLALQNASKSFSSTGQTCEASRA
ncbi:MAG: BCCT family transporter [Deltaproteobacteria bacterium]|jgi:BCCT family betaine/carnitine transporter|nr:BCCT family transporter [Deltaproteobacteria bacterium]